MVDGAAVSFLSVGCPMHGRHLASQHFFLQGILKISNSFHEDALLFSVASCVVNLPFYWVLKCTCP